MAAIKTSELTKKIKKLGCRFLEHGSRHDIWINPKTGGKAQVPRHKSAEIPIGTVEDILKNLGLK
jgi:predicted RNA binding protein YcfA (HicA-like mRNA interferase family)